MTVVMLFGDVAVTGAVLAYEVLTPLSEFNYVEDISGVMDKKLATLRKHEQIKDVRCDEAAEGLSKYGGAMRKERASIAGSSKS